MYIPSKDLVYLNRCQIRAMPITGDIILCSIPLKWIKTEVPPCIRVAPLYLLQKLPFEMQVSLVGISASAFMSKDYFREQEVSFFPRAIKSTWQARPTANDEINKCHVALNIRLSRERRGGLLTLLQLNKLLASNCLH